MQDDALKEIEESQEDNKVVNLVGVKTELEKATEWQANADSVVEEALLKPTKSILTVKLEPFTSARGSLLRRAKNEFIAGIKFNEIEDPFMAIGKFLVLMSVTLNDGRTLVSDPDALESRAYELLDTISINSIEQVVLEINAYVAREMSTQVQGDLTEDMKSAADKSPKN
jgi:hypothetical protein